METKTFRPYIIVVALLSVLSIALAITVDITVTDEAGIVVALPDKVGNWTGDELRFCQNGACGKQFAVSELGGSEVCPECGGELGSMTMAEKGILPEDTVILKKRYVAPSGDTVFVSIVMSGVSRASIHRPQVCLSGQGNEIVNTSVLSVPIAGRKPLDVTVLDMTRHIAGRDNKKFTIYRYYAYWFVGKDRETPYHIQRMIWMAYDRIFHNVSHRWAYISVSGERDNNSERYKEEISSFLHDLYPMMLKGEG